MVDEDGFQRYMGPSSGVGLAATVLQEILGDDQPPDPEYYCLFSLDDFARSRALEAADSMLWSVVPTNLPGRAAAEKVWHLLRRVALELELTQRAPGHQRLLQLHGKSISGLAPAKFHEQRQRALQSGHHWSRSI